MDVVHKEENLLFLKNILLLPSLLRSSIKQTSFYLPLVKFRKYH